MNFRCYSPFAGGLSGALKTSHPDYTIMVLVNCTTW